MDTLEKNIFAFFPSFPIFTHSFADSQSVTPNAQMTFLTHRRILLIKFDRIYVFALYIHPPPNFFRQIPRPTIKFGEDALKGKEEDLRKILCSY